MKLSLTPLLILLFIAIKSFSQETKEIVKRSGDKEKKVYTVLKENKTIKHGLYKQYYYDNLVVSGFYKMDKKDSVWERYTSKGSVLSKRIYSDGKKTGTWEFYKNGDIEWQYDFNKDSSVKRPNGSPVYSYQSVNGEWIQGQADREPVWLCSPREWQYFLTRTLRYPSDAIDKNKMGKVLVEITIDENGDAIDYAIAESAYASLDAEAIRVMELFQPEFSPTEKDGKKLKIKIKLPITFRLGGRL